MDFSPFDGVKNSILTSPNGWPHELISRASNFPFHFHIFPRVTGCVPLFKIAFSPNDYKIEFYDSLPPPRSHHMPHISFYVSVIIPDFLLHQYGGICVQHGNFKLINGADVLHTTVWHSRPCGEHDTNLQTCYQCQTTQSVKTWPLYMASWYYLCQFQLSHYTRRV